eukprot:7933501-Pyramimonas_sp.AAC.1
MPCARAVPMRRAMPCLCSRMRKMRRAACRAATVPGAVPARRACVPRSCAEPCRAPVRRHAALVCRAV